MSNRYQQNVRGRMLKLLWFIRSGWFEVLFLFFVLVFILFSQVKLSGCLCLRSLSEGGVPQCVSVSAHQWGLVSSGSRCKKDRWFHSSPLYSSHSYSDIRATSIWKLIVCHPFTAMFDLSFDTCACFGPVLLPAACYCCCLDTACSTISRFIMWLLKNTSMEKQFLIKVR